MGHSQGSHRAARGSRHTRQAPARVPAAPVPPQRSLHEQRTIVAGLWPGRPPVHDPTVLDTPLVPRQAAARTETAGHRAARRRLRSGPEALRQLVHRALILAVLAGGTGGFLAQDKAVRVSVDGASRTLYTFADDVGELLEAEGVTVGTRDIVVPGPATALEDGDEVVVLREARGFGPVPGGAPRAPWRP
ncbi:ubiquitin-like domain-containing protein [Streptomyces sp. NPDC002911]